VSDSSSGIVNDSTFLFLSGRATVDSARCTSLCTLGASPENVSTVSDAIQQRFAIITTITMAVVLAVRVLTPLTEAPEPQGIYERVNSRN
jgi:hypothetical protein